MLQQRVRVLGFEIFEPFVAHHRIWRKLEENLLEDTHVANGSPQLILPVLSVHDSLAQEARLLVQIDVDS